MAAKKKSADEAPTYADASAELEQILDEIEGDADIDELSKKVERAAELIRLCREKLGATEMKVQKVVADLEKDLADASEAEDA